MAVFLQLCPYLGGHQKPRREEIEKLKQDLQAANNSLEQQRTRDVQQQAEILQACTEVKKLRSMLIETYGEQNLPAKQLGNATNAQGTEMESLKQSLRDLRVLLIEVTTNLDPEKEALKVGFPPTLFHDTSHNQGIVTDSKFGTGQVQNLRRREKGTLQTCRGFEQKARRSLEDTRAFTLDRIRYSTLIP